MFRNSIAETLGTSLPSFLPGGSEDVEIPNTTKSSNLDALLSKAQVSTSAQRESQLLPNTNFGLQQPSHPGIQTSTPIQPQQQIASPVSVLPTSAMTQLLQANQQVQQPATVPQTLPQPLPQTLPQASFLPVQPSAISDVALEAQMLQHQLAQQTGDMQTFLKSELNKLSAAMRSISLSPPRMSSLAQPTSGLPLQNSQPYSVPPHVVSQELQLQDSIATIQPVSIRQSPLMSRQVPAPTYATPPVVTSEMVTEAQKRVASPVWDSNFVSNNNTTTDDNLANPTGLTAPMLASLAIDNFSEATTSMPTIHCLNDSEADPQAQAQSHNLDVVINPPSASSHGAVDPEVVKEHVLKLKRSLNHVEEAGSAMQHASTLGAVNFESLVDVLHEQYPTLERKEVALTWRSLITAYQQASVNFAAKAVVAKSRSKQPKLMYELDESPPPTPKSSTMSNLSEEYAANNYETTLKEVMSFIDKRMCL
eukprot:TRINITY_DN7850_c1_g1_i1.p1 TRINITY_DN7850_c1_g1~~TRINITY_DN7850_c1_g1_i1.p1  ORF type:complete len:479 (+),score=92.74 TRINITY_DN7850_c1_g1_i1:45-1481(+)